MRSLLLAIFAHLVACIWVMGQPGLGGLGYLSAFAVGLILLFTAPLLGVILLMIPTLIGLWQHRTQPLCAPRQDIGYWVLGPGFGSLLGVLIGSSLRGWLASLRLRWVVVAWLGLGVMSLCWHIWRFYVEPSVFLYHPVVGYLAGPIYDAQESVPAAYLVHRLWWLATLPFWIAPWFRGRTILASVGLLMLALGFIFRSPLGFDPGRRAVEAQLSHVQRGQYTVLHVDPDAYTLETIEVLQRVLDHHVWSLTKWLELEGPLDPVDVYLFASSRQKQRLIGAGTTEVAKPWLREIYVGGTHPDDDVLRHELAHALAADWVPDAMGVPTRWMIFPHMVLVEGLATAATWETGILSPHGWTALMDDLGMVPDLRAILGPSGFWQSYGPMVYTISASFIGWYREEFGAEKLRVAYAAGDLAGPVSSGWDELQGRWRRDCLKPTLAEMDAGALELARERFQRKPMYRRPCGLQLPSKLEQVRVLGAQGDLTEASRRVNALLEITEGDPEVQFVEIQAARAAGAPHELINSSKRLLERDDLKSRPVLRAKIRKARSDALWWMGRSEAALDEIMRPQIEQLPRALSRSIAVQRILLRRWLRHHATGSAIGEKMEISTLLDYLTGKPGQQNAGSFLHFIWVTRPEDPIVQYLAGFYLEGRGLWRAASESAFCRVEAPAGWPAILVREAYYRCGRLRAYLDDESGAILSLNHALEFEPLPGLRTPIRRWIDFASFRRKSSGQK
jgi:hypothetical protein